MLALGLCLLASPALAVDGIGLVDDADLGAPLTSSFGINIGLGTMFHPEEAGRVSGALFALSGDGSFWFAESAYGSLLGLEVHAGLLLGGEGEEGSANQRDVFAPILRTSLAWSPHLGLETPQALMFLGGVTLAGFDDVWWDTGGRVMAHAGARALGLLEYHYVRPVAFTSPHPQLGALDRTEHHFQLRSVSEFDEVGFVLRARFELGVTRPLGAASDIWDGTLLVSVGGT